MARRRVNVKFLGMISLGVLVVTAGAIAAAKFLYHENPKRSIERGNLHMREGHYADAMREYARAAELSKTDHEAESDILVLLGDATHEQSRFDSNLINSVGQQYVKALTESPTNLKALQKLMARNVEAIEFFPKAKAFKSLEDTAQKIIDLHPSDTDLLNKARAYVHIAPIAGWLHGIETPDEEIDRNMGKLAELMDQDRTNPDVPYYLALGYISRAMEKRRQVNTKEANALFRNAVGVFDRATAADPENSVLLLRYYQVLQNANVRTQDEEDVQDDMQYVPRMREVLVKARALVDKRETAAEQARQNPKPGQRVEPDPALVDVYTNFAEFSSRRMEGAEAEKMLRHLVKIRSDDQAARLALANVLHTDPTKRKEAIALLQLPISDPGFPGIGAYRSKDTLEGDTWLALSNDLIEEVQATTDPAQRATLITQVQEAYQKLADRRGLYFVVVRLQGRIQLLTPGPKAAIAAIQILERARLLEDQQRGAQSRDWELTWYLASANVQAQQTGRAKEYLLQICAKDGAPSFLPARILLTKLFLADNEMDAAFQQIQKLKELAPDLPEVRALNLQYLSVADPNNPELVAIVKKIVGSKLDGPKSELWPQILTLLRFNELDKAVTTLESMRVQTPADVDIVQMLVQIYVRTDQKPKAEQVVNEAIKKAPDDARFKVLSLGLQGAPQEKILEAQREAIGQTKEPFNREMEFFEFETQYGFSDKALTHLETAEKLPQLTDAQKVRLLDIRFQLALQAQKWDVMEPIVKRLTDMNGDEAHGTIYRFRLLMARQDFDGAGAVARKMVKDLPEFSQSHLCLAQQLQATSQFEEAEKQYEIALSEQTQNILATKGIIECYYALNLPKEAERYIKDGVKKNPGSPYFKEQRVLYLLNYGDPREAVVIRQQQWEANKKALESWLNLGAAWYQVAQVALKPAAPREAEAKHALDEARKVFTDATKQFPEERLLYAYLADVAVLAKDFAGGEQALKQYAARPAKEHPEAPYIMLGDYYVRFNKYSDAEKALLIAQEKAGNSPEMQMKLESLYALQGDFDKAIKALDPESKDRRVQQRLVETLIMAKKLDAADKLLQKLVTDNPTDAQFLATQGFVYLNENNQTAALKSLNRAIEADPKNHGALYYRGSIEFHQTPADLEAAVTDLSASRDLNPTGVEVRLALADALRSNGQVDEAVSDLEKAIVLVPSSKDLRMKLIESYAAQTPPRWVQAEHALHDAEAMEAWKKDPDWRRVEASMWVVRTQYDKALDLIRAAISLSPPNNYPLIQDYLNILELGRQWRDLQAQCDLLLQNQQVADEAWWVYRSRAVARRYLDQRDQSLLDYDTALRIANAHHNDDAAAMVIQSLKSSIGVDEALKRVLVRVREGDNHWAVIAAFLFLDKGDNRNAVAMIETVLAQPPQRLSDHERDTAQNVAAMIYISVQDYEKARTICQAILSRNADDLAANNNMACLLGELITPTDPKKAKAFSEKAMVLMKDHHLTEANVMDTHGWILTRCGQVDEGAVLIQRAIAQRPIIEGYYHMGQLALERNSPVEALSQFRKAKELIVTHKTKLQQVDLAVENRVEDAYQKALQLSQPATAPSATINLQIPKNP